MVVPPESRVAARVDLLKLSEKGEEDAVFVYPVAAAVGLAAGGRRSEVAARGRRRRAGAA